MAVVITQPVGTIYVRNAHDVADRLGWALTTVYVNRRRSLLKLDTGRPLSDADLPVGRRTLAGLRWSDTELDTFIEATRAVRRRAGHRRPVPVPDPGPRVPRRGGPPGRNHG